MGALTKKRLVWTGIAAAVIVAAAGGLRYAQNRTAAREPARPRDPGFAVVLAIRTLEREEDTRLSKEQIRKVLPFVKALKDIPASDEAGLVIARHVRGTFTPAQQAALEEARKRFEERQRQNPSGGAGGGVGSGEGGPGSVGSPGLGLPGAAGGFAAISDEQRAQFRTRAFERLIRYLERRSR